MKNTINITMATMKLVTKAIVSFYPYVEGQVKGDNFGERLKPLERTNKLS